MASASGGKRRRTNKGGVTFIQRANRPIDKVLPGVSIVDLVNAQQVQTIITASTACTATGLRWFFNVGSDDVSDVGLLSGAWAIIILRDGRTANTLSLTGGANLYEPEQDVLAFGAYMVMGQGDVTGVGPGIMSYQGDTKTMRKLKIGDALTFIALGDSATKGVTINGTIQVFCKF